MKFQKLAVVASCFFLSAGVFAAGSTSHQHSGHGTSTGGDHADAMANGQIKRINKRAKKLTIKHGEIKNLDMPPMTMEFHVQDAAMLDAVKKGDQVKFSVEDRDGKMIITTIKGAQ